MIYIFEDTTLFNKNKDILEDKAAEIWVITNDTNEDSVNYDEFISQSFEPICNKIPKLFTVITTKHPDWDWNYKVFVRDLESLAFKSYVVPLEKAEKVD